jgi:hypothetical protein
MQARDGSFSASERIGGIQELNDFSTMTEMVCLNP